MVLKVLSHILFPSSWGLESRRQHKTVSNSSFGNIRYSKTVKLNCRALMRLPIVMILPIQEGLVKNGITSIHKTEDIAMFVW